MHVVVNTSSLPVYKKYRITSLVCIFETSEHQPQCKHQSQWRLQQILYNMSLEIDWYMRKNQSFLFSGSRKISTLGSTIQWETGQASFPTGTVRPWVGIFQSPLNTNVRFILPWLSREGCILVVTNSRTWSSCDVIVILSYVIMSCRILAYSRNSGAFLSIKCLIKSYPLFVSGLDRRNQSIGIAFMSPLSSIRLVLPNSHPRDEFFYLTLILMIDSHNIDLHQI